MPLYLPVHENSTNPTVLKSIFALHYLILQYSIMYRTSRDFKILMFFKCFKKLLNSVDISWFFNWTMVNLVNMQGFNFHYYSWVQTGVSSIRNTKFSPLELHAMIVFEQGLKEVQIWGEDHVQEDVL